MSEETWKCVVCQATAKVDAEAKTFHAFYPADTGPLSGRGQVAHSCPVKLGLFPAHMEEHPNATKVR